MSKNRIKTWSPWINDCLYSIEDEILIGTETELFYQTKIDIGSEKNSGNYMKRKINLLDEHEKES